jgi:hypothetical protein
MVSKLKDTKYTTINDNNNKKLRIRLGIQNATNILDDCRYIRVFELNSNWKLTFYMLNYSRPTERHYRNSHKKGFTIFHPLTSSSCKINYKVSREFLDYF